MFLCQCYVYSYAPTARATPGVKAEFYSELQDALDKVPLSDILVI